MTSRLLAIKLMRQTATAAVYLGCDLHYVEIRQLASDLEQAKDSLIAFTSSLIEHFHIDSAVSEEDGRDTRAKALVAIVRSHLKERAIPYWSVEKSEVLAAYSEVSLKSVHELRSVVSNYWPHIIEARDDKTFLDAAALGLYIQTERMLSDNSSLSP